MNFVMIHAPGTGSINSICCPAGYRAKAASIETTWANTMNFVMKHAPGAGSISSTYHCINVYHCAMAVLCVYITMINIY